MFHCPSDMEYLPDYPGQGYFDIDGTSYDYRGEHGGKFAGKTWPEVLADHRSGSQKSSTRVWIVYDFEPVHGSKGQNGARNFLYLDGHVDAITVHED